MVRSLKKLLKLLISYFLFYSGAIYFLKSLSKLRRGVRILEYHRVTNCYDEQIRFSLSQLLVSEDTFKRQMEHLSKRCEIISLDTFVCFIQRGIELPSNSVVITFDDGYRDNYTVAYPILREYGISATFFLTTDYIGTDQVFWWDRVACLLNKAEVQVVSSSNSEQLYTSGLLREVNGAIAAPPTKKRELIREVILLIGKLDEERRRLLIADLAGKLMISADEDAKRYNPMLSWEEVREMKEHGMSFGSHTRTHPILTDLSQQARDEISGSKNEIERNLGITVTCLAYPGGQVNEKVKKLTVESGYVCGCSEIPGTNGLKSDLFALKRNFVGEEGSTGFGGKFSKPLFAAQMAGIFDIKLPWNRKALQG